MNSRFCTAVFFICFCITLSFGAIIASFELESGDFSAAQVANVVLTFDASVIASTEGFAGILISLPDFVGVSGTPPYPALCTTLYGATYPALSEICQSLDSNTSQLLSLVSDSSQSTNTLPLVYSTSTDIILTFESVKAKETVSLSICCFFVKSLITSALTTTASLISLPLSSPAPLRRLASTDWYQLRLQFDPATSNSLTTVSIVIQLTTLIPSGSKLVFYLPGLTCSASSVQFTVTTGLTAIFLDMASWTPADNLLVFQSAASLPASTALTLTLLTPFKLPITSPLNSPSYTARILSSVNAVIVSETSFLQSDQVYSDVIFLSSELTVVNAPPIVPNGGAASTAILNELAMSNDQIVRNVQLVFSANRPLFVGQTFVILLPGYQAQVREIPIEGSLTPYVRQHQAIFDPSSTIATMELISPLFFDGSGSETVSVIFPSMTIPMAQYLNDPSLKLGITEFADQSIVSTPLTSIKISSEINVLGIGKSFNVSAISFTPMIPGKISSIEIQIQPTISFFEKSVLKIFLPGGFSRDPSKGQNVALQGADAVLFESVVWDAIATTLTLTLKTEAVVPTNRITSIQIGSSEKFSLPPALSLNDKSLKIQSVSASVIYVASIKTSPSFGPAKGLVLPSSLQLVPPTPLTRSAITVSMVFNCQVHSGSTVIVHLGGFSSGLDAGLIQTWIAAGRPAANKPTRTIFFTSSSAVISNNGGIWDIFAQNLSFKIASVSNPAIPIGTLLTLTIPLSEQFVNPATLLANDQSVWLTIPESGIVEKQFFTIPPIVNNGVQKTFSNSQLVYGKISHPLAPIPKTAMSITLAFTPTFDILPGALVRFRLPGFTYPFSFSKVFISEQTPSVGVSDSLLSLPPDGTNYRAFEFDGQFYFGSWTNATSTLEFIVRDGSRISHDQSTIVWIQTGFIIPESKFVNDVSLQIQVAGNQVLLAEQLKNSPPIVTRAFSYSSISFDPQTPFEICDINLVLVSTVQLNNGTVIELGLPGFSSPALFNETPLSLISSNHTICSKAISSSTETEIPCFATWDSLNGIIFVKLLSPVASDTTIRITIDASAGFVFPSYIDTPNLGGLFVGAIDSIPRSQFTNSPLVATGAFYNQLYCVRANVLNGVLVHLNNEAVVPTSPRVCALNQCTANDWVRDPCSVSEMERCGCSNKTMAPVINSVPTGSLEISGFNLTDNDTVFFVHKDSNCEKIFSSDFRIQVVGTNPNSLGGFSGVASPDRSKLYISKIRGIASGVYNLCYYQPGAANPALIGKLFVRQDCPSPLVYFDGACDNGCPFGFVPRNGECEPVSTSQSSDKSVAITLTLIYPNADSLGLSSLPSSDATYIFFRYLMVQNLQEITSEIDPGRFVISSITNGREARSGIPNQQRVVDTVCVTVVITPPTQRSTRSCSELALLVYQLTSDVQSVIYSNSFLESVIAKFSRIEKPIPVVFCESTKTYLAVCPFSITPIPANSLDVVSWYYTTAIIGGIVGGIALALLLAGVYRIDSVRTLLGTRKSATNNVYNSAILTELEKNNDFSIIKISVPKQSVVQPVVEPTTPPVSPTAQFYQQVEELDPFAQAAFAKDWLEGRLMDVSIFLNPKRRLKKPTNQSEN